MVRNPKALGRLLSCSLEVARIQIAAGKILPDLLEMYATLEAAQGDVNVLASLGENIEEMERTRKVAQLLVEIVRAGVGGADALIGAAESYWWARHISEIGYDPAVTAPAARAERLRMKLTDSAAWAAKVAMLPLPAVIRAGTVDLEGVSLGEVAEIDDWISQPARQMPERLAGWLRRASGSSAS